MNSFFHTIWLIFSAALILLAIYRWGKYWYARSHWIDVKGEVVDIKEEYSNNNNNGVLYFPVIKYMTLENEQIIQKSATGSSVKVYIVGEAAEVFYNPEKNTEFEIKGMEAIMIPLLIFAGGLVFLLLGIFVIK